MSIKHPNAVRPVKAAADRAKVRQHIADNGPAWLLLFHDIALQTGWRTADICRLDRDAFNFTDGSVSITIAKQTKAAGTRAFMAAVRKELATMKDVALAANDLAEFVRLNKLAIVAPACPGEDETLGARVAREETEATIGAIIGADALARAVDARRRAMAAGRKTDTKLLHPATLAQIKRMLATHTQPWLFSGRVTGSNRNKTASGHVTRQSVWRALDRLRDSDKTLRSIGVNCAKFSAYSLRKSFAYSEFDRAEAAGKDGLAAARDSLGHSDSRITEAYLCRDEEEQEAINKARLATFGGLFSYAA
ncbi:hypothetical protein AB6T85_23630 [Erwinia sp. ACCC 02193]|uniref:Integrase n=1 Tax=Erwinia aeris TaxID=3239803 RepID=A0ABV4EF49_9GAMM